MSDTAKGTLGGRDVELRRVNYGQWKKARKVYEETKDNEDALMHVLAYSAHWADTGERVFQDVSAIDECPMSYAADLVKLAVAAWELSSAPVDAVPNGKLPGGEANLFPSH